MEKILNRIQWIDFAKGFVMILVVFRHTKIYVALMDIISPELRQFFLPENNILNKLIINFRMPFFFFMAGYLLNAAKWVRGGFSEFKSKLNQRLLIPYFAANFAWYPVWFIVCHCFGFLIAYNWINHAPLDAFFAVFIGSNRGFGVSLLLFQLWFLPCLFYAELIYLKLYNIFGEKPLYFFSIIVLLSACGHMSIFLPMSLDISLVSLTLILAGNLVRKYNFIEKLNFSTCIIIFMVFLVSCYFNTFIDMNNRKYGNFILFYINGIAGSLLVMKFSMLLMNFKSKFNDLISCCGEKSMAILILHPVIIAIMYDLIRIIANENFIRCGFLCIPAIVICAVLIPVWIAKNFGDKPVLKYFCK